MTSFQLFVFDFDGTLVDTKKDIADSVNRTLKELELRTLDRETLYTFIGKGVNHLMTRSLEGTGYDDLPRAIKIFMRHYEEHLMDQKFSTPWIAGLPFRPSSAATGCPRKNPTPEDCSTFWSNIECLRRKP